MYRRFSTVTSFPKTGPQLPVENIVASVARRVSLPMLLIYLPCHPRFIAHWARSDSKPVSGRFVETKTDYPFDFNFFFFLLHITRKVIPVTRTATIRTAGRPSFHSTVPVAHASPLGFSATSSIGTAKNLAV